MDFTSIEFYTIAFVVAMTLVGFFLKQRSIKPASSFINAFELEKTGTVEESDLAKPGRLTLTAGTNGTVTFERTGLRLADGETVNIIATVIDDKVTIEEKKGKVSAFGGREDMYTGRVDVKFFLPNNKVYVRYDSSVTGQWAKFSFKNLPGNAATHELRY